MRFLVGDEVSEFKSFFTKPYDSVENEVATAKISPSGLDCPVAVWYKLNKTPMMPDIRSFEDDGYASAGSARHKIIQEFISNNPNIEWADIKDYVEQHNLPFKVEYEVGIEDLAKKYNLTCDQVCELTGSKERLLKHTNNLLNFKLDGLIKFKDEYYILEIKTASTAKCAKAPLDEHQLQGKTYSYLLGINKIIWVYESRETFKHTIVFQEYSEYDHTYIKNYLNKIVLAKTPKELTRSKNCKYCRYRNTCEKDFKEEPNELF